MRGNFETFTAGFEFLSNRSDSMTVLKRLTVGTVSESHRVNRLRGLTRLTAVFLTVIWEFFLMSDENLQL